MRLMRRMVLAGLAAMAAIAMATAIWPAVAGVLSTVLATGTAASMVLVTRWVRGELAWRRELLTMPAVDAAASGAAPSLAELQEPA